MARNCEIFCDIRLFQILQNRKPCLYELGNSDIKMSEKKKRPKVHWLDSAKKKKKKKGALTRPGSMNPANKNW